MKKLLSVVLASVMVLAGTAALIPTAWAEPSTQPSSEQVTTRPEGSWVYYEQDFDSLSADLKDVALATELGWTKTGDTALDDTQTMMLQDGKLRFVSQYTKDGTKLTAGKVIQVRGKRAADYKISLLSQADERMISNPTVIEYDIRYQRRAADESNDVTVSTDKVIKADGQDMNAFFSVNFGDDTGLTATALMPSGLSLAMKGQATNHLGATLALVDAITTFESLIPTGTEQTGLEYKNYTVWKESNADTMKASGFGVDYHVKAVLDPIAGTYYLEVNNQIVAKLSDKNNYSGTVRELIEAMTSSLSIQIKSGVDLLLDNLVVYGYTASPRLVISEVAANGCGVNSTGAIGNGYQWVELYNPTNKPVNVYDFALVVNNMPTSATSTFGQNSDVLGEGGTAEVANRGSSIGYLRAGEQTFIMANEETSSFTNPSYENGVLQPGETAVVVLPDAALLGNRQVNAGNINRFFRSLNMAEGTKVFMCNDGVAYPMVLASDGGMVLGLMELDEDGNGKYVGRDDSYLTLLESYLLLSAEINANGGKVYEGYAMTGEFPIGTKLNAAKASVEISYSDWNDVNGSSSKAGFMKYNSDEERPGADGEGTLATPGYVPEACRAAVSVKVKYADGSEGTEYGRFMAMLKLTVPEVSGCTFLGYRVNGADALVNEVFMSADGMSVELVYEQVAPKFLGYQIAPVAGEGSTWSIRLLGGVHRFDVESVGFEYTYSYVNENGKTVTVTDTYQCEYVYTAVTVSGAEKTADELGTEYLFALHISDIPQSVSEIRIEAKSFLVKDKFTPEHVVSETQSLTLKSDGTSSAS